MIVKRIEAVGDQIVVEADGAALSLPAGGHAVERVPHVARAYLSNEERGAFEMLMGMGLGCAGVIVRRIE